MIFQKVDYKNLNGRQKEVYNFHKIAAVLADYGFNSLKLTDDWQGADFLAYQMLGSTETLRHSPKPGCLRGQAKCFCHVSRP